MEVMNLGGFNELTEAEKMDVNGGCIFSWIVIGLCALVGALIVANGVENGFSLA